VRSSRELMFALLVVAFVWASLFGRHWLPVPIQSLLFVVVLLLAGAMIAASWWCWIKSRSAESVASWRKKVGLLGVIANTTALAIPLGSLLYMVYCPFPFIRVRVHLPMIDAEKMVLTCLVFSLCGLIAGILSPPRSRFATALGGLIIGSIILSIPMGIL
jgi:hypothetical protein